MDILGIGVGVSTEGILHDSRNTLAPSDFAYWCSTYVAPGYPSDYADLVLPDGSLSLVSWGATQVGITDMPSDYTGIYNYVYSKQIPATEALKIRGALLFSDTSIAVALGLTDILYDYNGRSFIKKANAYEMNKWFIGALIPGLGY